MRPLRVLNIEDSERDVELLRRHLTRAGYDLSIERVETAEAMSAALDTSQWDVILCDYSMPHFNSLRALAILKETQLDLPFIIISGTIGESVAVEAMRAGAHDYLMKDNLARLAPTIEREMHEAENRGARRRAETALRESEDRYRDLVEYSHDLIFTHDLEGRVLSINQTAARNLGYDKDTLLGRHICEVFVRDFSDEFGPYIAKLENEGIASGMMSIETNTGEKRTWQYTNTLRTEGVPSPIVRGRALDVTEQRRAEVALKASEAELRESEERYKGLIDSAFDGVVIHRNGIIGSANRAYAEMLGYEIEELIGLNVLELVPPEQRESVREGIARDDPLFETIGLKKDGTHINIEVSATACLYEGKPARLAAVRDITERKQAEKKLQQSERRFRQLAENINEVFWVIDPNKNEVLYVSPAFEEIWGRTCESLYKQPDSYLHAVHPEDHNPTMAARDLHRKGTHTDDEYRIVRPDGSIRWIHDRAFPIMQENGQVSRVVGIAEDITERKRTQDALRDSEARYRLLFDRNPQPMWVFDLETLAFLEVNDAAVHHYGYSREEFLSMTIRDIRPEAEIPALMKILSDPNLSRNEVGTSKHQKKDGAIIDVEINSHELTLYDRPALMILAYDVTERTLLEEQLRHSQKMEGIGQLAGGIAHDFNNLLTVITGYSDLANRHLREEDPLHHNIIEIKKAAERAATLTRQLLAFSRKQVLQPRVIVLNEVVSELEKLLRRLIGENIELRTVLGTDLESIRADPGQIEQVLMNLAVNARDAMPDGGKLTIETENVYLDSTYTRHHLLVRPGPYVMLAVTDTGTGIDEATRARIFEPFFTTKGIGKGTGLGLSTVYGIVKQSEGNILVYSEVGRGTTFKIYLPRVEEDAQEYKRTAEIEEPATGTETILVAEDEEVVRKLSCEVLGSYGYQVLEAGNGGTALLICESRKGPIDLLITDVVMPEMGGRELAVRLHRLRPEMKVLYMSGYTDNAIIHQEVFDAGANFIQKPFSPNALARKVREVLSED